MPKQPATRAKDTVAAIETTIAELEARSAEHNEALQDGFGDELDGASIRALQTAVAVAGETCATITRARLAREWTAQRAVDALDELDLDATYVPNADHPDESRVDVVLKRGGAARILSRADTEAEPGYTIAIYGADVTGNGGHFATALVAEDDDRLRELVALLAG